MISRQVKDREAILAHIHSIFRAYIEKDRDAIRRTHTPDWTGFQGPSTKIERGIDDYMVNAEQSLKNLDGVGYELLDTEVQIHGDLGIVYYVARYDYRDRSGAVVGLPLRSIDIYQRVDGKWIQSGSHITPIPSTADWGEKDHVAAPTKAELGRFENAVPRELSDHDRKELLSVREAVWRAWFSNDQTYLKDVLPDELIAIDADTEAWLGRAETLEESIRFAKSGEILRRVAFPRTEIQVFGAVAILYTTFELEIERDGVRKTTAGRGTEIFVRRNNRWVNSGWHLDSGK